VVEAPAEAAAEAGTCAEAPAAEAPAAEAPAKPKRVRKKKVVDAPAEAAAEPAARREAPAAEAPAAEAPAKPKRVRKKKVVKHPRKQAGTLPPKWHCCGMPADADAAGESDAGEQPAADGEDGASPRRGWWQRTFGA
jgi:ribonuclease E